MKKFGTFLFHLLWFALLTLLTQIGGLVWLVALGISKWLRGRFRLRFLNVLVFLVLYLFATAVAMPLAARRLGRVPLPVFANPHLKPENLLFALLNRHYVRPELRRAL